MTHTNQPIATFSHSPAGDFFLWLDENPLQVDGTGIAYHFTSDLNEPSESCLTYAQNYSKLWYRPFHSDYRSAPATPNFTALCDAIGTLLAQA